MKMLLFSLQWYILLTQFKSNEGLRTIQLPWTGNEKIFFSGIAGGGFYLFKDKCLMTVTVWWVDLGWPHGAHTAALALPSSAEQGGEKTQ